MKNHKHISISLFRVSADSKYLDMIFSCPQEYYFTSLQLEVRYYDPKDKIFKSQYFDLSAALFKVECPEEDPECEDLTIDKKHWTVRLPLEKLGIQVPAIYKCELKANAIDPEERELIAHTASSDVNIAYKCMLHDLLDLDNLSDPCVEISDDVIRKYLLLYGHQAAMTVGDDEVAERYFKLIINCFDLCVKHSECGCCGPKPIHKHGTNCNCGK